MSRGINKVILVGNLGQDPEVRYLPNGGAVANVSLATSESWTDKNSGQRQEKTEWHRVIFFGKLADVVAQYVKKGSKLYVEGKLQTRKWQDQAGNDKYTTEIVVDGFSGQMQMLDGAGGNNNPAQQPQQPQQPQGGHQNPSQQPMSANNPYQQASGGSQRSMSQQPMPDHPVTQGAQNIPNNGAPAGGGYDDFNDDLPF